MTTTFYNHWRDVPEGAWRWKNFSPAEIACRGTGKLLVHEAALDRLQALRERLGKPFIVRSAYRSLEHNRAVGGATHSKHMEGTAFDIAMSNHDPVAFEAAAREAGFLGFGFYPRSDFFHIDFGPKREWGERFAPRPAFAREAPPVRERLAESRTIKGGGVAGVATVGAAGVEVAQGRCRKPKARCCRSCPISTAFAGCPSPRPSPASPSRSKRAPTTGSRAPGDRHPRRRARRPAMGTDGALLGRRRARHHPVPAIAPEGRRARRAHGGATRNHGAEPRRWHPLLQVDI